MDTISAGATIAWAMEAYEKGVLTPEDTDGVKLEFRDGDAVVEMLQKIARREGIGDLLAEGSKRAAEKLGDGSEEYLTTVKGMEMAMHDPRHMPVMRASYLLAPTGGDHMRQTGDKNGLRNQVGMCHFLAYDDDQTAQIINAVTGWGVDREEMVATAHRGLTLARLFNMREGLTRADDRLPRRFYDDLPKHKGLTDAELEQIVTDYYVEQGWDAATGKPLPETIAVLGLEADAVGVL
jgi:aldehyde:ferredoxin oxidoreductase